MHIFLCADTWLEQQIAAMVGLLANPTNINKVHLRAIQALLKIMACSSGGSTARMIMGKNVIPLLAAFVKGQCKAAATGEKCVGIIICMRLASQPWS